MFARAILAIATSALLAACANSDGLRSNVGGRPAASKDERDASKQTLASKVLGAIALERVTGRKPDPARFNQLR
jgi:hypothetical protein